MACPAMTGPPPYYAVIFTNTKRSLDGYGKVAKRMMELAGEQPGYLGMDNVSDGKNGIFVSYWRSEADILAWQNHPEHADAQSQGRSTWFQDFSIRICLVERAYAFTAEE